MQGWMAQWRKQAALICNIPAAIATVVFAIIQNDDSTSPEALAGLRISALISVAWPHLVRLKKTKLLEDKLQKYVGNLASAALATAATVTAYSWGAALTTAELAVVGVATILNACIDACVPESTALAKLIGDINTLQLDAKNNVAREAPEVVEARVTTLNEVKTKIRDRHGLPEPSVPTSPPLTSVAAIAPPIKKRRVPPRPKARSHSPHPIKTHNTRAREKKPTPAPTPFRAAHMRSAVRSVAVRAHK